MRILQLCNKPPYPPIDGGCKAMHGLTMGLIDNGHQVKVLCIATPKHPFDRSAMPADYLERTGIEGIFTDTGLNIVDAFTDLVTADNYNISRFFSPDMDIRLIRLLSAEAFDVVLLESLFMTPYIATIRRYTKAPIVLRSHNLEHVIQERIAHGERHPLKKPYRRFLARQLKAYEIAVLDRVTAWRRSRRRMRTTSRPMARRRPSPRSRSAWTPLHTPSTHPPGHRCSSTWAAWTGCRTRRASAG